MVLIGKVLPDSPDKGLPEAVIVHIIDHAVAIHPVALMLPEQQQAALGAGWLQGKTQVAEDGAQVLHGEDIVAALSRGQKHGAQLGLQLQGHTHHQAQQVTQGCLLCFHLRLHLGG